LSMNHQENRLEAILNSAVDAIIAIRKDGTIEAANPAATRLFQYGHEEIIGRNVKFLMPAPHRANHDGYLKSYVDTRQRKIIGIGREVEGLRKDGSIFPMHLSVGEFEVDGEQFFTGIIHDLSERKAAESALQQAQKMETLGQLTGGIAHDFNNLLTVITGNLELLDMQLSEGSHKELLDEALEATDLGARLTHGLLAFARRSPLDPETVDVNEVAIGLTDLLQRTLGPTIDLGSVLGSDLWPTKVDRAQLESGLVNLAINARDAMPKGGKLVIETRNAVVDADQQDVDLRPKRGEYVQLAVTDTGHGMAPETLQRALEPFFTTKEVGRGTGLGLSMVLGFAQQSGGHLAIYSEVGVDSTVNMYLPRQHDDGQEPEAPHSSADQKTGNGETILVVEDDPKVRKLTTSRLQRLGYMVHAANDGEQAREMLNTIPDIDLVFTDLVMPGELSGYEVAQYVQRHFPEIPVLLTSGYAEELTRGEKLQANQLTLLRKPYRLGELAEAVTEAMA
ncbi:MAG: PAS domain S-box protein, partial [Anderseniella sp.]|nr:PAS domain S-box protein [Anderseniella sp.]